MRTTVKLRVSRDDVFAADVVVAEREDGITLDVDWSDPDALLESLDEQWDSARNSIVGQLQKRRAVADRKLIDATEPAV